MKGCPQEPKGPLTQSNSLDKWLALHKLWFVHLQKGLNNNTEDHGDLFTQSVFIYFCHFWKFICNLQIDAHTVFLFNYCHVQSGNVFELLCMNVHRSYSAFLLQFWCKSLFFACSLHCLVTVLKHWPRIEWPYFLLFCLGAKVSISKIGKEIGLWVLLIQVERTTLFTSYLKPLFSFFLIKYLFI